MLRDASSSLVCALDTKNTQTESLAFKTSKSESPTAVFGESSSETFDLRLHHPALACSSSLYNIVLQFTLQACEVFQKIHICS